MVKFVSYSGAFPNLCSGTLVLEIDDKPVELVDALCTGGYVFFDEDWNECVGWGPWTVDLPENLEIFRAEIEELVNSNVPWGCCGGCV